MSSDIPALRGSQLYRLLLADGWEPIRRANHGIFLTKHFSDIRRTTIVKNTRAIIPSGTLGARGFTAADNAAWYSLEAIYSTLGSSISRVVANM